MRYLGIDYGTKRVGLAISDSEGKMAFPLDVLDSENNLIPEITKICKENDIGEIVVGESLDFHQNENLVMEAIKPFVKDLQFSTGLPISLHPEFLTSQEAERIQGKNNMHDASAAALILKSYLDLLDNNK